MYFDSAAQRDEEEWARMIDPDSGAAYWYNNFTGESVWAEDAPQSVDAGFRDEEYNREELSDYNRFEDYKRNPTPETKSDNDKDIPQEIIEANARKLEAQKELMKLKGETSLIQGGNSDAPKEGITATEQKLLELKNRIKESETSAGLDSDDFVYESPQKSSGEKTLDELFAEAHAKARELIVSQSRENKETGGLEIDDDFFSGEKGGADKELNYSKESEFVDRTFGDTPKESEASVIDGNDGIIKLEAGNSYETDIPEDILTVENKEDYENTAGVQALEPDIPENIRAADDRKENPNTGRPHDSNIPENISKLNERDEIPNFGETKDGSELNVFQTQGPGLPHEPNIPENIPKLNERHEKSNLGETKDDGELDMFQAQGPSRPSSRASTSEKIRKTAYALDFVENHLKAINSNVLNDVFGPSMASGSIGQAIEDSKKKRIAAQQANVGVLVGRGNSTRNEVLSASENRQDRHNTPDRIIKLDVPTSIDEFDSSIAIVKSHRSSTQKQLGSTTTRSSISNTSTLSSRKMQPLRENTTLRRNKKSSGNIDDITNRTAFIVGAFPTTMNDGGCKRYIEAFGAMSFFKRLEKAGHNSNSKRKFLVKFESIGESIHAFEYLSTATIGSSTIYIEMINNLVVESLIGDMLAGASFKDKTSRTENFVETHSKSSPSKFSPQGSPESPSSSQRRNRNSTSVDRKLLHVNEKRKRIEEARKRGLEKKAAQREQQRLRYEAEQDERKRVLKEERALRKRHKMELHVMKKRLNDLSPNKSAAKLIADSSPKFKKSADASTMNDRGKVEDDVEWIPLTPSQWPSENGGGTVAKHDKVKGRKKLDNKSMPPVNTNVGGSKRHQLMSPSTISSMLFDSADNAKNRSKTQRENITYLGSVKSGKRRVKRKKIKKKKKTGASKTSPASAYGKKSPNAQKVTRTSHHLYKPYLIEDQKNKTSHRRQMRDVRQYKHLVSSSQDILDRYDNTALKPSHRRSNAPSLLLTPILQQNEDPGEVQGEGYLPDWSPSSNERKQIPEEEVFVDDDAALLAGRNPVPFPKTYKKRVFKSEYGRARKVTGFSSLPSLTLYQNYKKIWSQSLRQNRNGRQGHVQPKKVRKKLSRKQRNELARKRAAWNGRFQQQEEANGNDGRSAKSNGVTEFSGRKYMLRRGSHGAKSNSGEVWDEQLKMFYRKRYEQ
jgi:hypothetical protein